MARNKIFISYSHRDQTLFNEFLTHLKPWQDGEILDVWTDVRIQASQKWHEEIQTAVGSTAVAVLLISPDFMASDYIRNHEIPPLLTAAEERQLALTCLYLRPSQVADDDYAFTVQLAGGETRRVKLTAYQGLNQLDDIVEGKAQERRDELLVAAAQRIKALYREYAQGRPRPPFGGQRPELTIKLELDDNKLYRAFYSRQSRLATNYSVWSQVQRTPYPILFGADGEETGKMLQALFPHAVNPTPIFSGIRVRIQTAESELAELPWTQTAWNGKRLWDYGWTFELVGAATPDEIAAFPNLRLPAPCPVLLAAPGTADSESHLLALEGRLDLAWPAYRDRHSHVKTRARLEQALQNCRPCIVYYYGQADGDGKSLRLHLDDGPLDVTELPQLWRQPPRIVFFNLLEESPIQLGNALAALHARAPLVVAQTGTDREKSRRSAKGWLQDLLQGGDDQDPIDLLHQHGLATVQIWGRYEQWRYNPPVVSPREKLARLLLDRENQRRAVQGVVSALAHDRGRRLSCLLACGDESDLAHLFVEQLLEYLRLHSKREACILPVRLHLPPKETFTQKDVEAQLRRLFSLSPTEPLRKALEKYKRPTPEQTRLVLLLDWGVRGAAETPPISDAALQEWVRFCADKLCVECPSDMRLLSVLTLQRSRQEHEAVTALVEQLSADPQLAERAFTMEELHPLGNVRVADLNKFFKDEHTSCPKELIPEMPRLIWQKTQGRFDETVKLIEEAEEGGAKGWVALHQALLKDATPSG